MWRATYVCSIIDRFCYPVQKLCDRDPRIQTDLAPLCTDHNARMRLARVENLHPPVYTASRRKRTGKRFNAEQMDLF